MKTKDEMSVSQIFNRMENLNISSGRTLENYNRPISAAVKRPDSRAKINNSYFNLNNTPIGNNIGVSNNLKNINIVSIVTDMNAKRNNYSTNKNRVNNINLDKERLYEDTIHLKNTINELKKDISNLKSENHKFSLELNKKDKIIEEILIDSQNNMFNNNPLNESKVLTKAKETHLFIQTKKQFKELKNEYKAKCLELESVKKNLKLTKINEIAIELKVYMDELARIKSLYLVTSKQNEVNERKLKDFDELHHNYTKQQYVILTMQDKINKYENDFKAKNEEINSLKNLNLEKTNKVKKLKAEIKILDEINQKISKDKKIMNDFNAIKTKLDKQLAESNKEILYYKELSDKKDRRLRDLESTFKTFNDKKNNNNNGNVCNFNVESIRNIQDNPEDKTDKTLLYLRSKLKEANNNYEKLQKKTKILEDKLKLYENQYEIQDYYNSEYVETNELSSMNEYSYIIIKNFEAKKISSDTAINMLFEKIDAMKENITIEEILELLYFNFVAILDIKSETDSKKLKEYLKNMLASLNNNWNMMKKKLIEMLSSIKIYSEIEETTYRKKLSHFLKKNQGLFIPSLEKSDPVKKGFLSFLNLRKILENVNLNLEDKYIEYLIYIMKSYKDENSNLDDLKYSVIYDILNEKNDESLCVTEEKNEDINEEGEIVITSEQYRSRLKAIFTNLKDYLKKSNMNIREFFQELIFRPTFEDPNIECDEDAIFLSSFIEILKTINIHLDSIDSYCIYIRLKIVENFEAISFNFLEEELRNLETGNDIDQANLSKSGQERIENNNKIVDVKLDLSKNENTEKIEKVKMNENSGKKFTSSLNEEIPSNDNKNQKGTGLIETDSEKESLDESDESDSKSDSNSSSEGKVIEIEELSNRKKEDVIHNMEEKYSRLSEKVKEVDEKEEDSYGDSGFDRAIDYSIGN